MTKREIRCMTSYELEERAEGEEKSCKVRGYASTFDEYELFFDGNKHYCERIEPTAFDECDLTDVVFRVDHTGPVYARTSNGLVKLGVDEHGLFQETELSKTEAARALYEDIKLGNYPQMSFAFTVEKDRIERKSKDTLVRIIEKVKKCYDVSPVTFPANPFTDIAISPRSAFEEFESSEEQELLERAKAEELEAAKAEVRKKLNKENDHGN